MKKSKIRILDIVFVVLVLIFVFVVFRQRATKEVRQESANMILTMQVDEIKASSVDFVKEKDTVIDKRRNIKLGLVDKVYAEGAVDSPDSEFKGINDGKDGCPSYKSLKLDVLVNGRLADDGIYINSTRYLLNETLTFTVGDLQIFAKLMSIEVKDEK